MGTAKRKRVDALEQAIETVLDDGNFISYKAAWEFVDGLQHVANRVVVLSHGRFERRRSIIPAQSGTNCSTKFSGSTARFRRAPRCGRDCSSVPSRQISKA